MFIFSDVSQRLHRMSASRSTEGALGSQVSPILVWVRECLLAEACGAKWLWLRCAYELRLCIKGGVRAQCSCRCITPAIVAVAPVSTLATAALTPSPPAPAPPVRLLLFLLLLYPTDRVCFGSSHLLSVIVALLSGISLLLK